MSSTRNKRKRPENDPNSSMVHASRRRSRESRAIADAATASPKNEAEPNSRDDETAPKIRTDNSVSSSKADTSVDKVNSDDKAYPASKPLQEETISHVREPADGGAGSSESCTPPKAPLHLAAGGNETKNMLNEDSDPDAGDRASKIRDLIAHRSLLLSRISLCKRAAEKRLVEVKAAPQITGKTQKTGVLSGEITDDEEIQAHHEMTRIASLAAKKARGEGGEGPAEKRTSLSLRRGASVGKRMNAALSALSPGLTSTLDSSVADLPLHAHATSSPGGKSFLKQPPPATTGQTLSAPKATSAIMSHAPMNLTNAKNAKSASGHGHPLHRPTSLVGGPDGKQIRTPGGRLFKSSTPSMPRTDQGPASLRPSHPHSNLPNRLPQPKTNFTEAMLLRKRRDALNAKLRAVLDKQNNRGSDVDSVEQSASPTKPSSRFSSSGGREIGHAEELPNRRKTHWDRLLQEMSWLATDFIEERKWKMSSARTLAAAVSSSGANLGPIDAASKNSSGAAPTNGEIDGSDSRKEFAMSEESTKDPSLLEERKYMKPSYEDTRTARKTGRLMSSMISELGLAMTEEGAMGHSDDFHTEARSRYNKIRAKLLQTSPFDSQSAGSTNSLFSNEGNPQCGDVKVDVAKNPTQTADSDLDAGELTFSDISKRIRKLGLPKGRNDRFAFKDLSNAVTGEKLNVSAQQKEMIEFVEGKWSTTSAGAMISGLPVSGKTLATCCLLWNHRLDGPQLIICPPASMLRWKYEISLFKDLRVLNFGLVGGIGCALKGASFQSISPVPCDVVLCEYSSVGKILELVRAEGIKFLSLCIDCRHPEGIFGCIGSDQSRLTRNKEWHGSTELITVDWWDNIMGLAVRDSPRRLMIDYCDPDTYSLDRSGLGKRQQLEIMSLRTAFLVGPRTFRPSLYPLPRTVISWARHQQKKDGEDKFERVRRILQETIAPLSIDIKKVLSPSSMASWDLRECEMPNLQRQAYDTCCSQIRGALSSSLGAANMQDDLGPSTYHAVSTALFRLRQICLTSCNLEGEHGKVAGNIPFVNTEPCSFDATPTEANSFKMASDNSSQPDTELAEVLLTSSAKFLELVAILRSECGHDLEGDATVGALVKLTGDRGPTYHHKVVILANLPRTQWLLSILLGSLGVRHKLIRREFSHTFTRSSGDMSPHHQAALAWAESQNTLLAFNSERGTRDKMGIYDSANILIVSPDSLASWHGGIGIDNADTVISLDEDWSGREMGALEASMSRWHACSSLRKTPSKLIRLICKSTIEENIFKSSVAKNLSDFFQWPLDRSGNHILYMGIDELVPIYREALQSRSSKSILPGFNVLRLRGEPLDCVLLSSSPLAPLFGKGSEMLFLPLENSGERDTSEVKRELFLLRFLFELESRETSKDLSEASTDSLTFTRKHHFGSGVLPPEPGLFPEHVMSRSELQFLSIRYYFERQILQSGRESSGLGGVILSRQFDPTGNAANFSVPPSEGSIQNGFAMANAWRKSGLGSKPDELARSLLNYRSITDAKHGDANLTDLSASGTGSSRLNAYSRLYSTAWDENCVRDGSQGCEPVVFFPPLHPKIQLAPAVTKQLDPVSKQALTSMVVGLDSTHTKKRKEIDVVYMGIDLCSKRPRTDTSTEDDLKGKEAKTVEDAKLEMLPPEPAKKPSQVEKPSPPSTRLDNTNTAPDGAVAASMPREHDEGGYNEDDYGLLGRGLLPLHSALLMANESIRVGKCSGDDLVHHFLAYDEEAESCWSQDSEDALELIALFVKRRPRNSSFPTIREQQQGPPFRHHSSLFQGDPRRPGAGPAPTLDPATSIVPARDVNGDHQYAKKAKKNTNSQVESSSAFTRISNVGQTGQPRSGLAATSVPGTGKATHRHRMLATFVSRQFGTGLSMFESSSFRVAMLQIQNRVKKRVDMALAKSFVTSDVGPGLPLGELDPARVISEFEQGIVHFASIVQDLKPASNTCENAKALAATQRSALRRSLVSPCRVDFGPFAGGFLSSPAGMTGIAPPRSRQGVSLPMGVKVTQNNSTNESQPSWTTEENKLLQEAAVRYGMNWIIVARALSGVEGFLVTETEVGGGPAGAGCRLAQPPRSARQCRDHWQSLARSQPSLANEVRKSEKILRENALKMVVRSAGPEDDAHVRRSSTLDPSCNGGDGYFILLSRQSLYKQVNDEEEDDRMDVDSKVEPNLPTEAMDIETKPLPKRSFSTLKAAMTKIQITPLTIPVIPPAGGGASAGHSEPLNSQLQQPVVLPSHPSHMQSVQASVAAQWSKGRTEMWPLQILDCAEKHRATVRASTQRAKEQQKQQATTAAAASSTTTTSIVLTIPTSEIKPAPSSSSNHRTTTTTSTGSSRPTTATISSRPNNSTNSTSQRPISLKIGAPAAAAAGQAVVPRSTSSSVKSSPPPVHNKSDKNKKAAPPPPTTTPPTKKT